MEITLEFEDSDIIVEFKPEFDVASNCVDIGKVQWKLQNGNHSRVVADVFGESQDERIPTECILPDL